MKKIVAQQLDRLMRVSPILSISLLVGSVALNVVQLVSWRGHPYIWMFLSVLILSILVLGVSNLWAGPLGMIAAMRGSQAFHDPVQVYKLTPFERMLWQHGMIPQMEHQLSLKWDEQFATQIERLRKWCSLGYIPKDEFPCHLKHYYFGKEGEL